MQSISTTKASCYLYNFVTMSKWGYYVRGSIIFPFMILGYPISTSIAYGSLKFKHLIFHFKLDNVQEMKN